MRAARLERHEWNPGVPFSRLEAHRAIATPDSGAFRIGVLGLPSGRTVGVVRIARFSQYEYPDLCERVRAALGLAADAPCEDSLRVARRVRGGRPAHRGGGADGSNAVGGITPDVLIPWRGNDSRFQRATRAVEALARIAAGR